MMNINQFEDKIILISGGSGSWGRELTKQLIEKKPKEIIIFSRSEISQVDMERSFCDSRIRYVIGDVRDINAVDNVMKGVDYVFQLAALKHVPICENNPKEAIKTNIIGTINLIDSAIKYKVRKFIYISTDKAVCPANLYGNTKAIGERLTIQANCMTKDTDFICIRGGNTIGTNGSVVPYIINQIKKSNKVQLTDDRMTRFFLTLPEAINLLFFAVVDGIGGETYIMNMPSFYIIDLVDLLISAYGDKNTKVEIIGMREGEKLHEVLISEQESSRAYFVNKDYYIIYPQIKTGREYKKRECIYSLKKLFTSNNNLKDKKYLSELLKTSGWIK